jgi:arsenite methyltransferase
MFESLRLRYLASQFGHPSGWVGRWLIGPWLDRISGPMNRLAFEKLQLAPDDDVLEVGFGGGALLRSFLSATRGKVVGIDISEAMVARARRRFSPEIAAGRLHIHLAPAERLPLPSASIDRACSVNNIYFWPDPAAVMAEFNRVIRPGGMLAIGFEPPEELRKWPGHRFGFRLFDEAEVRRLAQAAGFTDIEVTQGTGRRPDRFLCLSARRLDANG